MANSMTEMKSDMKDMKQSLGEVRKEVDQLKQVRGDSSLPDGTFKLTRVTNLRQSKNSALSMLLNMPVEHHRDVAIFFVDLLRLQV